MSTVESTSNGIEQQPTTSAEPVTVDSYTKLCLERLPGPIETRCRKLKKLREKYADERVWASKNARQLLEHYYKLIREEKDEAKIEMYYIDFIQEFDVEFCSINDPTLKKQIASTKKRRKTLIKKHNRSLLKLMRKIAQLECAEYSIEDLDREDSDYIKKGRYENLAYSTAMKIYRLKNSDSLVNEQVRMKLNYKKSKYPEVNEAVTNYVRLMNKRKSTHKLHPDIPTITDLKKLLTKLKEEKSLEDLNIQTESVEILSCIIKNFRQWRNYQFEDLFMDIVEDENIKPKEFDYESPQVIELLEKRVSGKEINEIIEEFRNKVSEDVNKNIQSDDDAEELDDDDDVQSETYEDPLDDEGGDLNDEEIDFTGDGDDDDIEVELDEDEENDESTPKTEEEVKEVAAVNGDQIDVQESIVEPKIEEKVPLGCVVEPTSTSDADEVVPETRKADKTTPEIMEAEKTIPESKAAEKAIPKAMETETTITETREAQTTITETRDAEKSIPKIVEVEKTIPETRKAEKEIPDTMETETLFVEAREADRAIPTTSETEKAISEGKVESTVNEPDDDDDDLFEITESEMNNGTDVPTTTSTELEQEQATNEDSNDSVIILD